MEQEKDLDLVDKYNRHLEELNQDWEENEYTKEYK